MDTGTDLPLGFHTGHILHIWLEKRERERELISATGFFYVGEVNLNQDQTKLGTLLARQSF